MHNFIMHLGTWALQMALQITGENYLFTSLVLQVHPETLSRTEELSPYGQLLHLFVQTL